MDKIGEADSEVQTTSYKINRSQLCDVYYRAVQLLSRFWLCNPMVCSTSGSSVWWRKCVVSFLIFFTISKSLLKFMSTEIVTLSNHFTLWYSLLLPSIFPIIKIFSNESALCIRWPVQSIIVIMTLCGTLSIKILNHGVLPLKLI